MNAHDAFLKYAAGAFQQKAGPEGTATFLSERNEALFQEFLDALQGITRIEALVKLLAMETPATSRDVRYELWVSVLQRIRELLGGDRDALLAEILVHVMYGEFDDAAMVWEQARDVYANDPEVLKVGLVVTAMNRDADAMRVCLDGLRLAEPDFEDATVLGELLEGGHWPGIQERVRYNPKHNVWFEKAAEARSQGTR